VVTVLRNLVVEIAMGDDRDRLLATQLTATSPIWRPSPG
jgi:hypothetical protein